MLLDQHIEQIADENNNPGLRNQIIADIWNSTLGGEYDSPEAIDAALTKGEDVALIADARQRLGLPIFGK